MDRSSKICKKCTVLRNLRRFMTGILMRDFYKHKHNKPSVLLLNKMHVWRPSNFNLIIATKLVLGNSIFLYQNPRNITEPFCFSHYYHAFGKIYGFFSGKWNGTVLFTRKFSNGHHHVCQCLFKVKLYCSVWGKFSSVFPHNEEHWLGFSIF